MKRLWIAAVAAGWAWAAQAGMGIVWSTCGWFVEAGGDANAGPGVAENNVVTWQLVYAGANNAPDAIDPSAAGWTGGDDVLLAERVVPAGGGSAADGTSWDSLLMQQGGNTTYEDPTWPADRGGFVFQRVFQGAPSEGTPYAESGLFAFDPAFAGNGAPPDLFYFPADGYGLVLDRAVTTTPPVPYLDPTTHSTNTCDTYTPYTGQTTLTGGWYVVTGDITNGTRIVVSGDAHLILADGGRLTAPRGITVEEGNRLTVFAQSDGPGMGALFAGTTDGTNQTCYGQCAGIGGNGGAGGEITINGGTVTATGGQWGAGIGGGKHSAGGKVAIGGGMVNATGGSDGAGIGGGWQGAGGDVAIRGGTVIAQGGSSGFGVSDASDPFENEPPTVDCGKFKNATVLVNYNPTRGEDDPTRYMKYASARRGAGEAAGYTHTLEGMLHFPYATDISDNGTDPTGVKVEVRIGNDVIANDAALQQYKFMVGDEGEASYVIHFTFTDEAGNVTECHQVIEVMEAFRPVPDCPSNEALLASDPGDGRASYRYAETPKARMDYWKHEKVGTGAGPADLAAYNALHGIVSQEQTEIYPYKLVSVAGNVETLITENNSTPEIVETRYLKEAGPAGTASWWNSNNNPDKVNKVFKRDFTSADKAVIAAAFSNLSIGVHAYRWYFRNNENREAFCDFVVTVTAAGTKAQAIGHGQDATDEGALSIPGMAVYASSTATEPVAAGDRMATCRSDWAGLKVCDPHECGDDGICDWCGAALVDLKITKEVTDASSPVYLHDTVVFTITVINAGPSDATAVEVAEILDPHLEVEDYITWDSYYDIDEGVWNIGFLANEDWRQLVIVAKVTSGGIISNAVSVTCAENDIDLSNNTAAIASIEAVATLRPPEVTDVTAAPTGGAWQGQVDISFNVTNDVARGLPDWNRPVLSIVATDHLTGSNYVSDASALSGDTDAADGPHSVTWDLRSQGIRLSSASVTFSVAYVEWPKPYCVIDLSGGPSASRYPVSYVSEASEVPGGAPTADDCRRTNLVLRLVEPGSFLMGNGRSARHVTLTRPFYMGVFETTQTQWTKVMDYNTSDHFGFTFPMEYVSWNSIRGSSDAFNWPSATGVGDDSFMGKLRARTGLEVDLPTEAQWEYACRAGTTGDYAGTGILDEMGFYLGNGGNRNCTATVGSYQPNDWGLYDMHGNVAEWCLDWAGTPPGGTDPVGPQSGTWRVKRGGSYEKSADDCTSHSRDSMYPHLGKGETGFRVCQTVQDAGAVICSGAGAPIAVNPAFAVTVVGGSTTNSPATAGTTVTVAADEPEPGKAFVQWTGDDGVVFADASAAETTFAMPATNVTATAVFAEILIGGLDDGGYPWTGKAVEPDVAVSLDGVGLALQRGRDYAVSYSDNVDPGTATLTVTMLPPGLGSRTASFTILPRPGVSNVAAAVRGPWSGKVELTFATDGNWSGLSGWNAPFLSIVATDHLTGSNYVADASALSAATDGQLAAALAGSNGTHAVTWDFTAQGIDFFSSNVTFTVAYLRMPDYCVIDLSGGTNATNYAVSYLDAVPEGGWTDLYKTTKLAMRLLAPGTFTMGGTTETEITNAFYCALFETTQRQWERVAGNRPSYFTNETYYATRPVEMVSWNTIRGDAATYDWPNVQGVASDSFVGVLRQKTGLDALDLPTEAQWVFACRAGTTTRYSYGDTADGDYMWFVDNSTGQTHAVGTKQPNAWGLYDMHGNVWEWCLDRYLSSGSYRVLRGGSWRNGANHCTSILQSFDDPSIEDYDLGFRLVRTLSDNLEGERGAEAAAGAERAGTVCAGASAPVAVGMRDFADTDIKLTPYDGPYDGQPHSIVVETNAIAGLVLKYAVGRDASTTRPDGRFVETSLPEFTDVTNVVVFVEASAPGHFTTTNRATVTITSRPVTFTGKSETKKYTGSEIEISTVVVSNLVAGHTHDAAFSASGTEVGGPYAGTITAADSVRISGGGADVTANYAVTVVNGALTIEQDPALAFTVSLADGAFTYDGEGHALETNATHTAASGATAVEYSKDGASWTNELSSLTATNVADSCAILVRATNPNYAEPATNSAALAITPRDLGEAAIAPIPVQYYEGAALEPEVSVQCAGRALAAGTDYTADYAANDAPGTATVTLTGMGNYTNETSATFQILPARLTLSVTAGKWGRVRVETNGVAQASVGPDATTNLVVGYGAEVSATAAPNAGFAVDGDDEFVVPFFTNDTAAAFSFLPVPEASLAWKYAKNANGWFCAQVALAWHPGYEEALKNARLLFADRTDAQGRLSAYLVNPATVLDPLGRTETHGGTVYRAAEVGLAAFAGLPDGARAAFGVSDATLASALASVPKAERRICLRVVNRDISTVAPVNRMIACLAWETDGATTFLPLAAAASPQTGGGHALLAPRPVTAAEASLAAAFGLAPAAAARGTVTCRIASMSFGPDGRVEGTFAIAAEDAGRVLAEGGALADGVRLSVLGSESPAGPFLPLDAAACGVELLSREPPCAFRVARPGAASFFKVKLECVDVYE